MGETTTIVTSIIASAVGTVAVLGTFLGLMISSTNQRIDDMRTGMNTMRADMNARFGDTNRRIDDMNAMRADMNARFDDTNHASNASRRGATRRTGTSASYATGPASSKARSRPSSAAKTRAKRPDLAEC